MSRLRLPAMGLALAAACTGCGDGRENPARGDLDIQPILVESVDVAVLESSPPQAAARVKGVVGDGCSELYSSDQVRSGSTVTVTILRSRPKDAICTQIARLYDETIRLTGTYPPGRYVVRVNGVEKAFTTQ